MNVEALLKKFLSSIISPESAESLAGNFESIGKLIAGLLAIFYVVGLIIFSLHYTSLHIRSIELFKVRYIFVGFYYLLFLFLNLLYPQLWLQSLWKKIGYLVVLLVIIILLNYESIASLSAWIYFRRVAPSHFLVELKELISTVLTLLALLLISISFSELFIKLARSANKAKPGAIFLVVIALFSNYSIFSRFLFPYIPEAMGGGQTPFVTMSFEKFPFENLPDALARDFPICSKELCFGRLVYTDGDSVFLQGPFWYSDEVYEVRRSDIITLHYGGELRMELIQNVEQFEFP